MYAYTARKQKAKKINAEGRNRVGVSSLDTGMDVESGSDPLTSVIFSPDGRVLFGVTKSVTVRQYDPVSGEFGLAIVSGENSV